MSFLPVVSEANNLVFYKVHGTNNRFEVADHDLDATIWEGADLGIGRRRC